MNDWRTWLTAAVVGTVLLALMVVGAIVFRAFVDFVTAHGWAQAVIVTCVVTILAVAVGLRLIYGRQARW